MSDVDTRRAGTGRTVSYATVRLESSTLLPEQLIELMARAAGDHGGIDIQVENHGTGSPRKVGAASG